MHTRLWRFAGDVNVLAISGYPLLGAACGVPARRSEGGDAAGESSG